MTIMEFVNARLDEYEAALQDTTSGPPFSPVATSGGTAVQAVLTGDWQTSDQEVLWLQRDLAAKRAIVQEYTDAVDLWERESEAPDSVGALEAVIRHMSAPYVDHPDYDPAWAA